MSNLSIEPYRNRPPEGGGKMGGGEARDDRVALGAVKNNFLFFTKSE